MLNIIYILNKRSIWLKYIKYNHMIKGTFLSHKTQAVFFKQALSKYGKVKNEKRNIPQNIYFPNLKSYYGNL